MKWAATLNPAHTSPLLLGHLERFLRLTRSLSNLRFWTNSSYYSGVNIVNFEKVKTHWVLHWANIFLKLISFLEIEPNCIITREAVTWLSKIQHLHKIIGSHRYLLCPYMKSWCGKKNSCFHFQEKLRCRKKKAADVKNQSKNNFLKISCHMESTIFL